jgi:hypothetical protein
MTDNIRNNKRPDFGLKELLGWKAPSGLAVPRYGVIKLLARAADHFTTMKSDAEDGLYYVNGPVATAVDGYGSSLMWNRAQPVLFDPAAAGLAVGDSVGPIADEWHMGPDGSGWRVFVTPDANNIGQVVIVGGGGGSGEIMYFTIDAVNCPGDGNWAVTPTHYSGGCEAPPGADPYTGEYIVVPRDCPMPEMPDELIGQEGIAARVYNLYTCELEWREIDHCPTIGC